MVLYTAESFFLSIKDIFSYTERISTFGLLEAMAIIKWKSILRSIILSVLKYKLVIIISEPGTDWL